MELQRLAGLAGVDHRESERAQRWGRRFDRLLVAVALLIPLQWLLQSPRLDGGLFGYAVDGALADAIDWAIWLFFSMETVAMLALVRQRRRYLLGNWMNLLIIAGGLPILWPGLPLVAALRSLRLLLFVGLLPRLSHTAASLLARNRLGSTLLVMGTLIATTGVLVSLFEPAIETPLDGVWWALVTASTVGYGDIVPSTPQGRAFAAVVILIGLAMVALITANISAFLVDSEVDRERRELLEKMTRIERQLDEIERRLRRAERGDD